MRLASLLPPERDGMDLERSMEQLEQWRTDGFEHHEEMMGVIRREIENGNYKELHLMESVNSEILCKFLITAGQLWRSANRPCYFLHLLAILGDRYRECVPLFAKQPEWDRMPPHHCAKIMAAILCLDHKKLKDPESWATQDEAFLNAAKCLVEKLVTRSGMTPPNIPNDNEIIPKCAEMISAVKFFRRPTDPSQIIGNLSHFPTLRSLFKDDVIEMAKRRETNWLVRMLGGGMHGEKRRHLSKIESVLLELENNNIPRRRQLIDSLKRETQTLDTLAEISLMAILLQRSFELVGVNVNVLRAGQTPRGSAPKDFDVLTKLGKAELYVEVLNHRNNMIDDLLECVHEPTGNIGGKIAEKYVKFTHLPDPAVAMLAIQTESSGSEVKNFLTQHEMICKYERLSAVFLFNKYGSRDLIFNPNATCPLPSSMINALRNPGPR